MIIRVLLLLLAACSNIRATCFILPNSKTIFGPFHAVTTGSYGDPYDRTGDTTPGSGAWQAILNPNTKQVDNFHWPDWQICFSADNSFVIDSTEFLNLTHVTSPAVIVTNPNLGGEKITLIFQGPHGETSPPITLRSFPLPNSSIDPIGQEIVNNASPLLPGGVSQGITLNGETVILLNIAPMDPQPPAPPSGGPFTGPNNTYYATGNSGNYWVQVTKSSEISLGWAPIGITTPDIYDEYRTPNTTHDYYADNMPFSTTAFSGLVLGNQVSGTISAPALAEVGHKVPLQWSISFN